MNHYLLIPLFLLYGLLSIQLLSWLKRKKSLKSVYTRKIFHILIFSTAGIIILYLGMIPLFIFGIIISSLVIIAVVRSRNSNFYKALVRNSDEPAAKFFIILPLISTAVGGTAAVLLFGKISLIGFFVSGWADGLAEPIGTKLGIHQYRTLSWGKTKTIKSLEGTAAVLIFGFFAALAALGLMQIPCLTALITALICSGAAACAEAFSLHGTDNFTVQIVVSGTAYLCLEKLLINI
jgi:phytol kinase